MAEFPYSRAQITAYYHYAAPKLVAHGDRLRGVCILHNGESDSLSVSLDHGGWVCHSKCGTGNIYQFEALRLGISVKEANASINEFLGVVPGPRRKKERKWRVVCAYDYLDKDGVLLFQVARMADELHPGEKTFYQRRPDPEKPGEWINNMGPVKPVLYRLPEVLASNVIYVTEGEKDADNLRGLGLVATSAPMGATRWQKEYTESLAGKHVVIIPDKDDQGSLHVDMIVKALYPKAASVKVCYSPKGKDASDWIAAGATKGIIEQAAFNIEPYRQTVAGPSVSHDSLERNILSLIFKDSDLFDKAKDIIKSNDFVKHSNRIIWDAMCSVSDFGPPDLFATWVQIEATGNGKLVTRSTLDEIAALTDAEPDKFGSYCRQLRDFTYRRMLGASAGDLETLAKGGGSSKDIAPKIAEALARFADDQPPDKILVNLEGVVEAVGYEKLLNPYYNEKLVTTPWPAINELIIGLKRRTLTVVATRPSVGKSAFCGQLAAHAAETGNRTAYISLEMPREGVWRRLLCHYASVSSYKLLKGECNPDERLRIHEAVDRLSKLPLYIEDQYGRTIREIRTAIKNHPGGLDLIIIDYFQLLKPSHSKHRDRRSELTEISIDLKKLALELNVALVLVASINREMVKAERAPQISDLYECGQIEYDADLIMMPHRPNLNKDNGDTSETDLYVRKQRDGAVGKVELHFNREFVRFESVN